MSQTKRLDTSGRSRNNESRLTQTPISPLSSAPSTAQLPQVVFKTQVAKSLLSNSLTPGGDLNSALDFSTARKGAHPLSSNSSPRSIASSPSEHSPVAVSLTDVDGSEIICLQNTLGDAEHPTLGRLGGTTSAPLNTKNKVTTQGAQVTGLRALPDLINIHSSREQPASKASDSPNSTKSSLKSDGGQHRVTMPRTSSIDSAISSISSSSHPYKSALDVKDLSHPEIRRLIDTAGSAENLIQHLLKEKHHTDSQNTQLWKLVDKQRALLLGLNKDLERLNREKERYERKVKDLQAQALPVTSHMIRKDSHSPVRNDNVDATERRDQQKVTEDVPLLFSTINTPNSKLEPRFESFPIDPAMMPPPLHLLQQQQSTKAKSQPKRLDSESSQDSEDVRPVDETEQKNTDAPSIFVQGEEDHKSLEESPLSTTGKQLHTLMPMQTSLGPPSFALIEPSPLSEKSSKSFSAARKAPKPLNLKQSTGPIANVETLHTAEPVGPVNAENAEGEDSPDLDRGRKKTREEDDRDRELAVIQEQEARSQSKKEKRSTGRPEERIEQNHLTLPALPVNGLPLSPRHPKTTSQDRLAPPASLASSLQTNSHPNEAVKEHLLMAPLRSPGLPTSPRPGDRPLGSPLPRNLKDNPGISAALPMSPKFGTMGIPLTPRAPKYPIPLPPNTRLSGAHPVITTDETRAMSPTDAPLIYQGLKSSAYPDLLLPPNALPSIDVKVASSRLRPPGTNAIGAKTQEESAVFSLSIFSRSNGEELWRIEKSTTSLPQLDQALRPLCNNLPKVPERRLFNGHAPAVMDARRNSINTYFDELLDTPMDENSGKIICRFLSTDTIDLRSESPTLSVSSNSARPAMAGSADNNFRKVGYLTKRGKNFGGWKSRYFVLDNPELRYFESPGGAHLGTIKLLNAQIGKQSQTESPISQSEDPDENQYRHAFLVLEPKRKDSNSLVKHVLCAENDAERDEWVEVLLHCVDVPLAIRPNVPVIDVEGGKINGNSEGPVKSVNYADTVAGARPEAVTTISKLKGDQSSPTTGAATWNHDQGGQKSLNISGPINGAVISDAGLWGNKPATQPPQQKKRNIFHFKQKASTDSTTQSSFHGEDGSRHIGNPDGRVAARPVFGLPLVEAVEYCSPVGVNVNLPAVVYRSIEYLRAKHAALEEGIFRLSGSNLVIRMLKERFNNEGDVDFLADDQYYDVHAVASLFKSYLRELPSTVLTRELHLDFYQVLELEDNAQKIIAFNRLVHQLPSVNFSLLRTLSQYLLEVVQNADKSKMGVRNVCIVFSPTLNIPVPVFSMFLNEFDAIFGEMPTEENQTREVEITVTSSLSPEDIRSPRRQLFTDLPTPAYNQTSFVNGPVFPSPPNGQQSSPTMNSTGGLGFTPIQQSYETRNYLSIPPASTSLQPRQQFSQQGSTTDAAYGSLNRMMSPENAPNAKAKRRESSMIFM